MTRGEILTLMIMLATCVAILTRAWLNAPTDAEAREYCQRPAYMMTTQDCSRIPTAQKPYCPFPR